jgi:uncharacterized membrane protein (DUF2068 family)
LCQGETGRSKNQRGESESEPKRIASGFAQFRSKLQVFLVRNRKRHNRWLELIAAYKLLQAALLVSVGVGALRLLHKDVADLLSNLAEKLRWDSEGRLVSFLLDKAHLLDDHMLRRISVFMFCYAAIGLLEGIGLLYEKVWAEYLTALITASFLPFEIMEIAHRVTWFRVGLLVVNLAVVAYLVSHLLRRRAILNRFPASTE